MDLNINPVKVLRIGIRSDHPHPLKIILPEAPNLFSILKHKKKRQKSYIEYSFIRIYSDEIPKQREYFNSLHQEVENRKAKSEQNLAIRYVKGNPIKVQN